MILNWFSEVVTTIDREKKQRNANVNIKDLAAIVVENVTELLHHVSTSSLDPQDFLKAQPSPPQGRAEDIWIPGSLFFFCARITRKFSQGAKRRRMRLGAKGKCISAAK